MSKMETDPAVAAYMVSDDILEKFLHCAIETKVPDYDILRRHEKEEAERKI